MYLKRKSYKLKLRKRGAIRIKNYLSTYKIVDIVDIKVDGSAHKAMPFKYYHGRTGRVFNVNPRAVGVEVMKRVGNKLMPKRLNFRLEHIKKSRSREEFI